MNRMTIKDAFPHVMKSFVLTIGLTAAFWVPLQILTCMTHMDVVEFRMDGGSIGNDRLLSFDTSSADNFRYSFLAGVLIVQSVLWMMAMRDRRAPTPAS